MNESLSKCYVTARTEFSNSVIHHTGITSITAMLQLHVNIGLPIFILFVHSKKFKNCWPGILSCFFFLKILFIYLTQREKAQAGREAGRERGRSRLSTEQGAGCGARSQDPGIMT